MAKEKILQDLISTPTIFVDGAQGLSITNGNVKINLFQIVQELVEEGTDAPVRKVIVGRLVMNPVTALAIADWIKSTIKEFPEESAEKDGK